MLNDAWTTTEETARAWVLDQRRATFHREMPNMQVSPSGANPLQLQRNYFVANGHKISTEISIFEKRANNASQKIQSLPNFANFTFPNTIFISTLPTLTNIYKQSVDYLSRELCKSL